MIRRLMLVLCALVIMTAGCSSVRAWAETAPEVSLGDLDIDSVGIDKLFEPDFFAELFNYTLGEIYRGAGFSDTWEALQAYGSVEYVGPMEREDGTVQIYGNYPYASVTVMCTSPSRTQTADQIVVALSTAEDSVLKRTPLLAITGIFDVFLPSADGSTATAWISDMTSGETARPFVGDAYSMIYDAVSMEEYVSLWIRRY